jgi:hypothetical protein
MHDRQCDRRHDSGCTDAANTSQGYAEVLTVDLARDNVTAGASMVFNSVWAVSDSALKVDNAHVVVAYQTGGSAGVAAVFTVSGLSLFLAASQNFEGALK